MQGFGTPSNHEGFIYPPKHCGQRATPSSDDNESQCRTQYEDSAPPLNGRPCHSQFFLEARLPLDQQPFEDTLFGRLPPEIREKIYVASFKVEQASKASEYFPWQYTYRPFNRPPTPHWIQNHKPVTFWYQRPHWPTSAQQQPALLATFPPLARPRPQTRLALLLVCRQVYLESWHLYYTTNTFDFGGLSSFTYFLRNIGPKHGAELSSIELTFIGPESDRSLVEEAVGYLAECRSLRYLHLRLCCNDRQLFKSLKTLRGCGKVDVTLGTWSGNRWSTNTWLLKHEYEATEREVEEIKQLLTRPKEEIGC